MVCVAKYYICWYFIVTQVVPLLAGTNEKRKELKDNSEWLTYVIYFPKCRVNTVFVFWEFFVISPTQRRNLVPLKFNLYIITVWYVWMHGIDTVFACSKLGKCGIIVCLFVRRSSACLSVSPSVRLSVREAWERVGGGSGGKWEETGIGDGRGRWER